MQTFGYWVGVGTALSQLGNALIGGHPDMSLSAHAHLSKQHRGWFVVYFIAEALFGEGHCEDAWEADVEYADDVRRIEREGVL